LRVPWDSIDAFKQFDITVGQPSQYQFLVTDRNSLVASYGRRADSLTGPGIDPLPGDHPYQNTYIVAETLEPVEDSDTLWIKTRDFAAHCLVTPIIANLGGKEPDLISFSPLDDTLYTVNVPRDYDGYAGIGINYGDQMADAWEEVAFACTTCIDTIYPFLQTDGTLADYDTLPHGRGFNGDYLTNFEEYRGVMIDTLPRDSLPGTAYKRIDPLTKSAFLYLRPSIERDIRVQMPAYTDSAKDVEINYISSLLLPDDETAESYRYNFRLREVNFNRKGASRWYIGHSLPTQNAVPANPKPRAITFWTWAGDSIRYRREVFGITYGDSTFVKIVGSDTLKAYVPSSTNRCIVALGNIQRYRNNAYYLLHQGNWAGDYSNTIKHVFTHEFGHAIGMWHPQLNASAETLMDKVQVIADRLLPANSFAEESLNQISLRRPK
jgi:hypothetical protein